MKMILRQIRHYSLICQSPSYRRVQFSKLFDQRYYLARYPDLKSEKHNLLRHYLASGWRERRRPSLFFDNHYYCREYLDESGRKIDPLSDYLEKGWQEGKNPNSFFHTDFYVERYRSSLPANINPLTHYLKFGWKRDYLPSPIFLERKFERLYYRLRDKGWNPLCYLLEQQERERSTPPDYFDAAWYHDRHPFLPGQKEALWHHYMVYGVVEKKSPVPVFEPSYYTGQNPDTKTSALVEPFAHYREKEPIDFRRPAPFFDPEFYRAAICRRQDQQKSLLEHFLKIGVFEGIYTDQRVADLEYKPLVSIVLPVYNPTPQQLNLCIRSVLYQAYPHWQLCICDDRSTEEHVQKTLFYWANLDQRIKVVCHLKNEGISNATNTAAGLASGEYLGFLDNDDELRRDCLYQVVKGIGDTGGDVLYTDEELVNDPGESLSVFYKPGYNRELLLGHNYITHFLVLRRELFEKCGGCDPLMNGAQDFDLALKVTEQARLVVHIPEVVYHWRVSENSTNINHNRKVYADDAGQLAVQKAFQRTGIEGKVLKSDWRFFYQPRRSVLTEPSVSVILHPVDGIHHPEKRLQEVGELIAGYNNAEILFTSGDCDARLRESYLRVQAATERCTFIANSGAAGKAAQLNRAAASASGDFLLFLSSEVYPQDKAWIQQLLEYGQDEEVGLVCGRLLSAESMLGISRVPDVQSNSPLYYWWFMTNCSTHMNGLHHSQEVSAVPLEICLVQKKLFDKAGGLNAASFPNLFMGMDLSYNLRSKGLLNIYTPYCQADWDFQSLLDLTEQMASGWNQEKQTFQKRWIKSLFNGDPYYHPGCYREQGISDEQFLAWSTGRSSTSE